MEQLSLLEDIPSTSSLLFPHDVMETDTPYLEVEAQLEEYLEMELAQFELLNVDPITESDINCKWKYSSAMQKSIRRGFAEDAVRYAMVFHSLDATGFWTRLVVVAFEDVGIAGTLELALTLIAAKSKVWRKKVGEVKAVQFAVQMLANAVKDRSLCDKMITMGYTAQNPKNFNALKKASFEELSEIVLCERHPTGFRISAAWSLWGVDKYENKNLPLRMGSREMFCSTIAQMKIPALVKYVTLRGMIACRFPMNLITPFMWEMKMKSLYLRVIETRFPENRVYITGLTQESFDQHNREGKQSISYFSKSCKAVDEFLSARGIVGRDARIAAVGASVFIIEGALLNRKIDYEGASEIYDIAEKSDYEKAGLSLEDGRELSRLVEANSEDLRRARIKVVEG